MDPEFEWDDTKAEINLQKHAIDFADAAGIFDGPVLKVRSDREGEERYRVTGILDGLEITVVYTLRGLRRRIISARRASSNERAAYHKAQSGGWTQGAD